MVDKVDKQGKGKLTAKQQVFCREYLIDMNASRAALAAGYSPKTAPVIGYENLKKPEIMDYLSSAMEKRAKATELTVEGILENIQRISKKAEEADNHAAALKGQELLGKYMTMFTDRIENTGAMIITIERGNGEDE